MGRHAILRTHVAPSGDFLFAGAFFFLCALTAWYSPAIALAALLAGGVLWATCRTPVYVVYALCVIIPIEPFALKGVSDEFYIFARYASEVAIYLLALRAGFGVLAGQYQCRMVFPFVLIVGLVGDTALSALVNQTPVDVAALGARQIVRFLILFITVVIMRPGLAVVRTIVSILFAVLLIESALGLVQAGVGAPLDAILLPSEQKIFGDIQLTAGTQQFWESGARVFATMGRYDQLGTFLSFVLLLGVGLVYGRLNVPVGGIAALFLLGIPALILTYSRASWFGFLLGLFVIGVVMMRDRRLLAAFLVTGVIALVYAGVQWTTISRLTDMPRQSVFERLAESVSFERWRGEYMGLGRLYFIVNTPLKVVAASPFFGVGPGGYGGGAAAALHHTEQYERADLPFGVYGTEGYVDNNWMSVWGELGTIGLGLYIFLMGYLIRAAVRVARGSPDPFMQALALGLVGAIAAVCFQAFLATYFEVRTLAFFFWLIAGLVVAEYLRMREARML